MSCQISAAENLQSLLNEGYGWCDIDRNLETLNNWFNEDKSWAVVQWFESVIWSSNINHGQQIIFTTQRHCVCPCKYKNLVLSLHQCEPSKVCAFSVILMAYSYSCAIGFHRSHFANLCVFRNSKQVNNRAYVHFCCMGFHFCYLRFHSSSQCLWCACADDSFVPPQPKGI